MRTLAMPKFPHLPWQVALGVAVVLVSFQAAAQNPAGQGNAVKLDTAVNSPFEEIMPLLAPDRTTLYFVRSLSPANTGGKEGGQDVWYSTRKADATWSKPVNLGMPINNAANNAICGITPDGNTIYLTNIYERKSRMEPGISVSSKVGDKWSVPTPIKIANFVIQRGYLGAYMTPNERVLFLSMKSDDAVGREDLYAAFKLPDNSYSRPINLGKTLNTVGFEISPFYSDKDSTLYFASNGHEGYGDADIFRTKRLDDTYTKWSKPENLGPQTNSDGFDAYLSITEDSSTFFVKEDLELRYADIYTIKLEEPIASKARKDSTLRTQLDKNKAAKAAANRKKKKQDEEDEGVEAKKKFLTDKDPRTPEEIYRELNSRNRLQNNEFESILFDLGKFVIRPEGKKVLDKSIKFLKQNPNVGIELVGHTDSIAGDLLNQILSDKRSFGAKEYLMRHGISRNRILNHGFGKQIYVDDNTSEKGRQQNRRCELNLLMSIEEFEAYKDRFKNNQVIIPATTPSATKAKN